MKSIAPERRIRPTPYGPKTEITRTRGNNSSASRGVGFASLRFLSLQAAEPLQHLPSMPISDKVISGELENLANSAAPQFFENVKVVVLTPPDSVDLIARSDQNLVAQALIAVANSP